MENTYSALSLKKTKGLMVKEYAAFSLKNDFNDKSWLPSRLIDVEIGRLIGYNVIRMW